MIIKFLDKWEPDLSKSIDDLALEWYLKVAGQFDLLIGAGILNTEITALHQRDDKYNRVIFTKDIQFEIRPASANFPNPEFPSPVDYDRQWHDDGKMYPYIIMWTNTDPTLIRSRNKPNDIFKFRDNDVFVIDNLYYEHRRSDLVNNNRLFARALISKDIGVFLAT